MPHELNRIIAAFCARPWAIDPAKGQEIAGILMLRHQNGPRANAYREDKPVAAPVAGRDGRIAVLNLFGPMVPRAEVVDDVSATFANVERFQAAFEDASTDSSVQAIVMNIDSPGGMVDLVPETAAMVREARREGRPIYAVANTVAASAAYWIASQADRFYASTSGTVGSIGVRMMHVEQSARDKMLGLKVTEIGSSPEKIEITGHRALSDDAIAYLTEHIQATYGSFVADVAAGRGVSESVVMADPAGAGQHFGRGRAYGAEAAFRLGMIDGVKTFAEVLEEARTGGDAGDGPAIRRSASVERAKLALL